MARPIKQGLDYFPMDCTFDEKTEMYIIETGAVGLGVLVTLWQMIYSNDGYFINANEDLLLLCKKRVNVDINEVSACINVALKRNIFDKEIHDKHGVLTSRAIQKRFFSVTKRKKEIKICKAFMLVNVNDYINSVKVNINFVSVNGNTTKESKVNKSKGKKSKRKAEKPPTLEAVKSYFLEKGYREDVAEKAFNYYASNNWHDGKGNKVKAWKQKMIGVWFKDENKKHHAAQSYSQGLNIL